LPFPALIHAGKGNKLMATALYGVGIRPCLDIEMARVAAWKDAE
jgi:hypothetical protein